MNKFAVVIRAQLDAYKRALLMARESGRADNVNLIQAQIAAYRIGLETCLNNDYVAMVFEDFNKEMGL